MAEINEVAQENPKKNIFTLISPLVILLLGNLAARGFSQRFGIWAWIGVSMVYWGSLFFILTIFGALKKIPHWLKKPEGGVFWLILAVVLGLISFPLLLIPNINLLSNYPLTMIWFFWGFINAFMEEVYWRGFLLDINIKIPKIILVVYSTLVFTTLHPLMWGVFSKPQAFDAANPAAFIPFGIILIVLSLAYAIIYLKTKSLRWAILSHFLSDLGNLSIFVFMNLISMPY